MKTLLITLTLSEELLGTASADPEIHREFIASKSPDAKTIEEEVAAIGTEGAVEKAMTIFPSENGRPFLWDYQVKGFFKDACGMLARIPGTKSNKLKAYKKIIDGTIFIKPRKLFLVSENGKMELGECQRPLRAQTAQGERIALAHSQTAPAGTQIPFQVILLDPGAEALIVEWLDYGALRGVGQWRNSGKGRFSWEKHGSEG